jgi:hypothetical protein
LNQEAKFSCTIEEKIWKKKKDLIPLPKEREREKLAPSLDILWQWCFVREIESEMRGESATMTETVSQQMGSLETPTSVRLESQIKKMRTLSRR